MTINSLFGGAAMALVADLRRARRRARPFGAGGRRPGAGRRTDQAGHRDPVGQPVTDNYRYMEALDPATVDWIKAEGAYTRTVLDDIPGLKALQARVEGFSGSFGFIERLRPLRRPRVLRRAGARRRPVRPGGPRRAAARASSSTRRHGWRPTAASLMRSTTKPPRRTARRWRWASPRAGRRRPSSTSTTRSPAPRSPDPSIGRSSASPAGAPMARRSISSASRSWARTIRAPRNTAMRRWKAGT